MYLARFEMMKNKRYKCTSVYGERVINGVDNQFNTSIGIVWLIVAIKPPIGFCKRPHKYL